MRLTTTNDEAVLKWIGYQLVQWLKIRWELPAIRVINAGIVQSMRFRFFDHDLQRYSFVETVRWEEWVKLIDPRIPWVISVHHFWPKPVTVLKNPQVWNPTSTTILKRVVYSFWILWWSPILNPEIWEKDPSWGGRKNLPILGVSSAPLGNLETKWKVFH